MLRDTFVRTGERGVNYDSVIPAPAGIQTACDRVVPDTRARACVGGRLAPCLLGAACGRNHSQ